MSSKEKENENPKEDTLLEELGQGKRYKVYKVKQDKQIFIRKEIKLKRKAFSENTLIIDEIEKLKSLKHQNIAEIVGSFIDTDKRMVYIYTKCYKKGDLHGKIKEKRMRNEDFTLKVFLLMNIFILGDNQFYERFNKWINIYSQ